MANAPKTNTTTTNGGSSGGGSGGSTSNQTNGSSGGSGGASKSMKFLKRTLSFTDVNSSNNNSEVVPKGFVAVCVGKEEKRFIIPTQYLGHQVFGILLRKAEEEFGFQQEGVLKIPCEVSMFENILNLLQNKKDVDIDGLFFNNDLFGFNVDKDIIASFSPSHHHHPQMCR
ncbi:Auxin responsive SAUR protein [Corchorus capsularis]|uniref:Auxin responsive SAUR protein n=1 Tax=Corchorus capsularis TaxID=210143 RepID=A0A1R3I0F4_COCAP|nr:Auxin responsive SAUR protein [Corchorus capsularis]